VSFSLIRVEVKKLKIRGYQKRDKEEKQNQKQKEI